MAGPRLKASDKQLCVGVCASVRTFESVIITFNSFRYLLCVWRGGCKCHSALVEVRGQLVGRELVLSLSHVGSGDLNSGFQAW